MPIILSVTPDLDTDPWSDLPDVALAHKYPVKLILARMAQMVDEKLLDYGVSLRTAFPRKEYPKDAQI